MHVLKHIVTDLLLVVGLFFSLGEAPAHHPFDGPPGARHDVRAQLDARRQSLHAVVEFLQRVSS